MGLSMTNALAVLLACLAAVNAVPVHFPHGKTVTYKYYADVKAGTHEPVPFASQFALDAVLQVRHDTSDPSLKNAYYITLTDVKYGLHNGHAVHHERIDTMHPISEQAKMIQDPFLIVYDENGKFQGVKLLENENGWSKNVKQAIGSMLQLDLPNIQVQTPMKPHSFMTLENTIHGTCQVSYNIQPKPTQHNVFVVTKLHEPKNCTHFVHRVFDHVQAEECHEQPQDAMTTVSRRVLEIESQGEEILIRKLVGHGTINYLPWNAKSEAHYLLTNQTLLLTDVTPATFLPPVNFQGVPIIRDVTYNKPQSNYALHAGEDLTQGRHIVKLDVLIPKLKKMLGEAADYLEENHIEMKEPDWKHGQTINRLLHTMRYMDLGSLEQVFNVIQDAKTPREVTIRHMFLGILPHVGTTATCHFTLNVIRKHKVSEPVAVLMLTKLPVHVKVPTERLLIEMEDLIRLDETHPWEVRKCAILCFATLIRRTFMHEQNEIINIHLENYLQYFMTHLKSAHNFQMKMVYLMAVKNVHIGNIHKLLEPIIRGDVEISERPIHIRVQAIWAIKECIRHDVTYAHNLLMPILTDTNLPLPLRIMAYDVLIHQLPHTERAMNIHWLMMNEKNEHLVNYHITTIKGLANSVDPCLRPVREIARKMQVLIRMRPPVRGTLSTLYRVDSYDQTYGHGETFKTSLVLDELTGLPRAGYIEHIAVTGRKPVPQLGIHWNAEGLPDIVKIMKQILLGQRVADVVTNEKIKEILLQAAKDMPTRKEIHLDICLTMNDNVVLVANYDKNTLSKIFEDYPKLLWINSKLNWQHLVYDDLFEMHVPTDMGLPAVLGTRIPRLMSVRFNTNLAEVKTPINLKTEVDARIWRHGEYVMSIYNPIADVWHSVRRVTAQDVSIPIVMNIGYNREAQSLKVTFPILPLTKLSVAGMLTHAKNLVTVTEDETDVLKKSCATCHHHEVVTKGTAHKKYHQQVLDSKDAGLQYASMIFDCETNTTPVTQIKEWLMDMSAAHKHTWNNVYVQWLLGIRQRLMNQQIAPEVGSCGNLIKIEPSILYPASHVDMNVRLNVEDMEHLHDTLHTLPSKKLNFRGTLDVQAAALNTSIRSWDMNVNIGMSQGHVNNNMKVQITRVTPGEKDLKICIDSQVNYPVNDGDLLKPVNTKDEVNFKVMFNMGLTDDDKCVRDDTVITLMIKSEMSEEQKKQVTHDNVHGICAREAQRFQTPQGLVPKTWNCIRETVRHSTLRKATVNVTHKKLPHAMLTTMNMIDDIVRATFLPHVKYTANHVGPGNVKVVFEYPIGTDNMDMSVFTPTTGYEYTELPFGDKIYNLLIDNTRFSIPFLQKYKAETCKICTIYPQVLITADNGTMPLALTDRWILLSGDHIDQTYAVLVKQVLGNKMAVRIQVGDDEITIMPTETKPIVKVNGNIVENHTKGVVVPPEETNYAMKLTHNFEHLIVQSQRTPLMMLWTQNSVSLVLDTMLQGTITGLCGHLDNTHTHTLPKIYNIAHL